ncbi:RNA 2'-phosphotransferase [bacterium]|nr:RNA 2'-phosphotransferase [bacterium]
MEDRRRVKLSKLISYILRHHPEKYGLTLDRYGFASLQELVGAISQKKKRVSEQDIKRVVEKSEKKRFEIKGDKIRATYGHTIEVEQVSPLVEPPEILFHGTSRRKVETILQDGLQPMKRQYVHLCQTEQEAYRVGRRKDTNPVVLQIRSRDAFGEGIEFRKCGSVYIAKQIPGKFIKQN